MIRVALLVLGVCASSAFVVSDYATPSEDAARLASPAGAAGATQAAAPAEQAQTATPAPAASETD